MLWLLIYLVVAIVIYLLGRSILRDEPTAHGQIVGGMVLIVVTVLWPIALCFFAVLLVWRAILAAKRWFVLRWQERFDDPE